MEDNGSQAKSTLPLYYSYENLFKIYTLYDHTGKSRERAWIHDVLDDNGIRYMIKIAGVWKKRKYIEEQHIYVEPENKDKAAELIKQYNDEDNILWGDWDDENLIDDVDEKVPQTECPACGKEIDFDFVKCPFCKAIIVKD